MPSVDEAQQVLKEFWGHDSFRPSQEECLEHVFAGHDTLGVLPTGYGKTAIFQVPALLSEGTALVISPLIALMKDQCDDCATRGIPASYVNSHVTDKEQAERFKGLIGGKYKVFYVAPERLTNIEFKEAVQQASISYLVLDEAHCHPPDTLITRGDGQEVRIDTLSVGDLVLSQAADGKIVPRRVSHHRVTPIGHRALLRIVTEFNSLTLTDDHEVFVKGRGYVPANEVAAGDTMLRLVPGTVKPFPSSPRGDVLQQEVLRGGAEATHNPPQNKAVRNMRSAVLPNEQGEPSSRTLLFPRVFREKHSHATRHRTLRLLRAAVYAAASSENQPRKGMLARLRAEAGSGRVAQVERNQQATGQSGDPRQACCVVGGWNGLTKAPARIVPGGYAGTDCGAIPAGPCVSGDQTERRVRREKSHADRPAGNGREAGCVVDEVRVVRVEVLQSGNHGADGARGWNHQLVHSLAVETDHNYFANGLNTHNCASTWGHDFRPAYQNIKKVYSLFEERPTTLAFTATATIDIVSDVAKAVGLKDDYKSVVADPVRPNLEYSVVADHNGQEHEFNQQIQSWKGQRGRYVIYVPTQKATADVALRVLDILGQEAGVGIYHAGLTKDVRESYQNEFKDGTAPIIIATCAFGMGIDVPDIRAVIHYGIPGSIENYVQESGRAGRDGLRSEVTCYYNDKSRSLQQWFIDLANPSYPVYQKLFLWLQANVAPTELLAMSNNAIAEHVKGTNASQIGAALQVMHAHGIVERSASPFGASARCNIPLLQSVVKGTCGFSCATSVRNIARAVYETQIAPLLPKPHPKSFDVEIDKNALCEAAGLEKRTVGKALEFLSGHGVWTLSPANYAHLTRLVKYSGKLTQYLPLSAIEKKRQRDQSRLDAMVKYAKLPNGRHEEFIRGYFLKPQGVML